MKTILFILLIIFVITVVLLIFTSREKMITGAKDLIKNLNQQPASKFEEEVRDVFQRLTRKKFPCVYPDWAVNRKKHKQLEIDGYNKELGIAFEVQGPQHTIFSPKYDEDYEDYFNRIENDAAKIKFAKDNGILLIVIDYKVPRYQLGQYVKSRLYDAIIAKDKLGKFRPNLLPEILTEKPPDYIEKIIHLPYRNLQVEKDYKLKPQYLHVIE